MKNKFDIIIIGGGHAGIEAAHIAANMGHATALITQKKSTIGSMPCNPSIGGLGKGHIVYEVSALGGLMPELCNNTYLSARMLNTSKGPAVQGLRLQIDKYAYQKKAESTLSNLENLTIIEETVAGLLIENSQVTGIKTLDGTIWHAQAVIVTTGTFLRGTIHVGLVKTDGGRNDEAASNDLSRSLTEVLGGQLGRLKTGTPPRLLTSSIDFSKIEQQTAMQLDNLYSYETTEISEKVPCYITTTNETTHDIIKDNFEKSAMYNDSLQGIGPRYCPSIEDKVGRFPSRNSHHVFVEPEGGDLSEVYPAGLSTSLPLEIQEKYIRSIQGFENAIISQPGYAVEYDFIQPTQLKATLETKKIKGLFCAGQVNGTTGYEEAAGQGLIAGINAALLCQKKDPFILSRTESYIGVMIDDLVTLGVDEPYRMFTSRAERRLLLRQDNVFARLMPYAHKLNLISLDLYKRFQADQKIVEKSVELIKKNRLNTLFKTFNSIDFTEVIKQECKKLILEKLTEKNISCDRLTPRMLLSIHAEIRYDGYIQKEQKEVAKALKYQSLVIPPNFQFLSMPGLRVELQEKLERFRPTTIAQAELIPGMTPAAISLLIFNINIVQTK